MQIKLLLSQYSLVHVWQDQGSKYKNKIRKTLTAKLQAQHDAEWYALISKQESKLRTYSMFKKEYNMENYLLICRSKQCREFSKLRISAHQLRVETGRYTRPHKIPFGNRTCLLWMKNISCSPVLLMMLKEENYLLNCLNTHNFFN